MLTKPCKPIGDSLINVSESHPIWPHFIYILDISGLRFNEQSIIHQILCSCSAVSARLKKYIVSTEFPYRGRIRGGKQREDPWRSEDTEQVTSEVILVWPVRSKSPTALSETASSQRLPVTISCLETRSMKRFHNFASFCSYWFDHWFALLRLGWGECTLGSKSKQLLHFLETGLQFGPKFFLKQFVVPWSHCALRTNIEHCGSSGNSGRSTASTPDEETTCFVYFLLFLLLRESVGSVFPNIFRGVTMTLRVFKPLKDPRWKYHDLTVSFCGVA